MNPVNYIVREDGGEIALNGYIVQNDDKQVYDFFGMESISPKDFKGVLAALVGKPLTVKVNSYGGSIKAGAEIYTVLMEYPGPVTFVIESMAASAASFVCAASAKEGSRCLIAPVAQVVIHNAQGAGEGDARDMEHAAEVLRVNNESIINAYEKKTGLPRTRLQEMMDSETWMTAQQAVELGFADEIIYPDGITEITGDMVAKQGRSITAAIPHLSAQAVASIRAALTPQPPKKEQDKAQALLDIEKQRFGGITK